MFWELRIFLRGKLVNILLVLFTAHDLPPSEFSLSSQPMPEEFSMSLPLSVVSVCLSVPFLCSYCTLALILLLCLVNSCLVRPMLSLMRILPFLYVNFLIIWATPAHLNMISSCLCFLPCIFFCILYWETSAKAEVLKPLFTLFIHWQACWDKRDSLITRDYLHPDWNMRQSKIKLKPLRSDGGKIKNRAIRHLDKETKHSGINLMTCRSVTGWREKMSHSLSAS